MTSGTARWPGGSYPLGASFDGTGTSFALSAEVAGQVGLCLLSEEGTETRMPLRRASGQDPGFAVPGSPCGERRERISGTADPQPPPGRAVSARPGDSIVMASRSVKLLRRA